MSDGTWQVDYGPKTERIRAELVRVAQWVHDQEYGYSTFGVELEPGDATHYEVFGVWRDVGQHWIGFMVGQDGGGSAVIPNNDWLYADWLAEALRIQNPHSARILADFLNVLFGHIKEGDDE